jgi:nitronate monooxygenase
MRDRHNMTELLKISLPLIQAPMAGGATTPELVAAVSNAGGLGSLGAGYMTPDEMRRAIKKIRELTHKPFAVNLFIPQEHHASHEQINQVTKIIQEACHELNLTIGMIKPPYAPSFEEQMAVILEEKIAVFSFTFGIPAEIWIKKLKENGVILMGTATTLSEATLLEKRGIDAIVAQGSEAGGHRGTFIGKAEDALIKLSDLVPDLIHHTKIPIIAAGGIMDAKGISAALALGASAVQLGTVFLTCTESGIHPSYKQELLNTMQDSTTLTRVFSGKLARGINNKFISRMKLHETTILDYPIQNALTVPMRKEAAKKNSTDFMSMWAGQSAYLCENLSVAELIKKLF